LEQDLTTMGLNNDDLFKSLQIKKSQQLSFILNELSKLNDFPLVKDYLWESLQLNLEIESTDMRFSKTYNLLPKQTTFYQNEILKKFDHLELIHRLLPLPKAMSNKETDELSSIIKKSLVLTRRETDPSTYMENNTLRLYELERGISIAIFGMNANRQMPLQSYIGYTLFKNGYPVAYGGSWIFGRIGWFGLNIFETFRGGESGYIMCQLLRVYKQVFNLDKIEVEPYQYGLGNPDGIKSGAFWFYYRYGFIPIDENLCRLAESETKKIKNTPNYRTNDKTLLKFTESNIALSFGQTKSELLLEIIDKVRNVIAKKFNGNRDSAIKYCINEITKKLNNATFSENEKPSLIEVALMSNALNIIDNQQLILLDNMIKLKVNNPYLYNKNLSLFLDSI
ncbi:MAG: hypothetical protein NTU43_06625, partial [Bacteroidetes bacterium]|nr:hypothetical protein [Bacteroidota bacterium]